MSIENPVQENIQTEAAKTVQAVSEWLQYFDRLETSEPLFRFFVAAAIIGSSILLLLATRIVLARRMKRLVELPEGELRPLQMQAQELVSSEDMKTLWLGFYRGLGWVLTVVFGLTTLTGVLMTSHWTMTLAVRMILLFMSVIEYLWSGFVGYLPDLFTIVFILLIAKFLIRTVGLIFDGIQGRRIHLKNFYPEWADTSFNIIKMLIYVLTAVIIFPYLPGSSSPAFQGISIFVGVLVSLGSTTAVANVVAGVVLTYTRAFKVGDQVEVAGTRGRIVERSTFVTRIQTLKNVVVSVPNAMVLNNNIINYSKNMGQTGLLVHSKVTIGYDVPWQKVNGLLITAANNTAGIASHPEPFVLQIALEDNYVSYEINGWTRQPEELPRTYSELHANILDEFHGHRVEITSPAYRAIRDGSEVNIPESVDVPGGSSEEPSAEQGLT